jgi:hypothetical protein
MRFTLLCQVVLIQRIVCVIWSAKNQNAFIEKPLHDQKVTV